MMSTYSLLQVSLDQKIDRETLEEASVAVRSVARADCAKIQRELFGILISGLEQAEAMAFQTSLKSQGFPTNLVKDADLPILHDPFSVQKFEVTAKALLFTDFMGRVHTRPISDLVFLAGGFLNHTAFKVMDNHRVVFVGREGVPHQVAEHTASEARTLEFLLDFFFWSEPHRIRLMLTDETTLFYQGTALRFRHRQQLIEMMNDLLSLLPPQRINNGLKSGSGHAFYPNHACYDEEIRWHFHRLKPQA